ncbi:MAG: hypothetical protein HYV63_14525 [Candidatus Schekmanbacteria bacterium]|nr:hypothetical protein [Candidatus Schekmanbacteria bacterium]
MINDAQRRRTHLLALIVAATLLSFAALSCGRTAMQHPSLEAAFKGKSIDGRFELCTHIEKGACQNAKMQFSTRGDKQVALLLKFVGVRAMDEADRDRTVIKWYAKGILIHETAPTPLIRDEVFPTFYRWSIVSQTLDISRLPEAFFGEWTVAVTVNESVYGTKTFQIVA